MKVYRNPPVSYITKSPLPQETLAINTESKEVQLKLTKHPRIKVRALLAQYNQDLFIEVVEILAKDISRTVRSGLAHNSNLSEKAQIIIAEQNR